MKIFGPISAAWLLKASKRHQVKLDSTDLEVNIKCSACQSLLFRVNEDPLNTYKASNLYRKCESGDAKAAEKEVHQKILDKRIKELMSSL